MFDVEFENKNQRLEKINICLEKNNIKDLLHAKKMCENNNIDVENIVKSIQSGVFRDAIWAYFLGVAVAIQNKSESASDAAKAIGIGLQAFCTEGSVAEQRKVGIGHGNLAAMLLRNNTKCFAFLAGHESFAAAQGAISIVKFANRARKDPLKVILNGLGKDAAYIISRINGFSYVRTKYDYFSDEIVILKNYSFSNNERAKIRCFGADDFQEGVAIMKHENVDVSITGNSTNPTRFQHIVAGIYKKWANNNNKMYFSVASGGGTGRTLHPDNVAAGPASYGLTDSMGRMHADAQFAGSSSVPAHVEMMGFVGMGNNPMVGATVACAVKIFEVLREKVHI
ncbi:MAG: GGGtGRT protein [Oscillospiraceae bacterium]|nr:GGGtGRT protein [Oscillospiraceae bacterium]